MVPVGIAAAVGVAVWMGLPATEQTGGTGGKKLVAVVSKPVEKVVPVVAGGGMNGAAAALERGKYAYLDRDANRLFMFVADQIPNFGEQK